VREVSLVDGRLERRGIRMGDPREEMKGQCKAFMDQVLEGQEWDNEKAPQLAKAIQSQTFEYVKQKVGDGYKIVVMAEVLAPGSGMAKSLMQLTSSDDYIVQAETKTEKNVMGYCLVTACKY